jgi:hypothetical protein
MRARWILPVLLAFAVAPAQAIATPGDIAATHAYVQANYALARASVSRIGAGQAQIERLNSELSHQCPGAGSGSPENEASQPLSHEVVVALWSLSYGADAGPVGTFVKAVGGLRWSDPRITRGVHRYATSMHELATLPLPKLCEDIRSWKASGFQVVPTTTLDLDQHEEAIDSEVVSPRLFARFERGGDASTLARTTRLETRIEENEFLVGQKDWLQMLETLGLNE